MVIPMEQAQRILTDRYRLSNMIDLSNAYLAKANYWEAEYKNLRDLTDDKPQESFWSKLEEAGLWLLLGAATWETVR